MLPTALIPSADGFEEIELVSIIDILRRAEISVTLASITSSLTIKGGHGINIVCDDFLHNCQNHPYDLIALAGGTSNAESLSQNPLLIEMLKRQKASGKLYASICASPALVFEKHGLLSGEKATCYPGYFDSLKEKLLKENVVISNKCITGKGPGTSFEFALALVEKLVSSEKAIEIARKMVIKRL